MPGDASHTGLDVRCRTGTAPGAICARGGIGCPMVHEGQGPFDGAGAYGAWRREPHRRTLTAAGQVQAIVEYEELSVPADRLPPMLTTQAPPRPDQARWHTFGIGHQAGA